MIGLWRRKPVQEEEGALDLGPVPSIFDRPPPPPPPLLTVNEIFPPCWLVQDGNGAVQARLRLMPDGRALGGPEGARWEQASGRLTIGAGAGPVWNFTSREDAAERLACRGTDAAGGEVLLMPDLDDVHMVAVLRRPSMPLTVVFNSDRNPFRGEEMVWEFAEHLSSNDFVLFAEKDEPSFAYMNKTARMVERLRMLPAIGYREFVFLGQGSGGFAAIMFAEMLGHAAANARIVSVTANPLSAFGTEHDEVMRERTGDASMRPACLDADALSQKDCGWTTLREMVRMNMRRRGQRIMHRVLYDGGNPAQAYQATVIGDLSGFEFQPLSLGLPPEEGGRAIAASEPMSQAIDWARQDWRAWARAKDEAAPDR